MKPCLQRLFAPLSSGRYRDQNQAHFSSQSSTGVADPRGHETGHFLSSAESATNPWGTWSLNPPTRLFVVLPAVPNTNGGLIENLFLIRNPARVVVTSYISGNTFQQESCVGHISAKVKNALNSPQSGYTSVTLSLSRGRRYSHQGKADCLLFLAYFLVKFSAASRES